MEETDDRMTRRSITQAHNPLDEEPGSDPETPERPERSPASGPRTITIHTDGACLGNPGPGGWGAVLQARDEAGRVLHQRSLMGGAGDTTNQRMELRAAIEGLHVLKHDRDPVVVVSDSKYVVDGMSRWLAGWKAKGWKTAGRKPVKNVDLWKELDTLAAQFDVTWQWIKGHAGDPLNDKADDLANTEALRYSA